MRLIDLGHMLRHDERAAPPLFANATCTSSAQCAAPHVKCMYDNLHTDAICLESGKADKIEEEINSFFITIFFHFFFV